MYCWTTWFQSTPIAEPIATRATVTIIPIIAQMMFARAQFFFERSVLEENAHTSIRMMLTMGMHTRNNVSIH